MRKPKTISNKIAQNNAQFSLYRQTDKISSPSSRNVTKYEFLTSKDVLPESGFPEKADAIKRFEYSSFRKELKAQTSAAEKLYLV